MNPKLSIILPCYNEAGNLPLIVARLREAFGARPDVEVVLVNNGSRDATAEILAKELADPALAFIRVEQVPVNRGYGFGIVHGLRAARGEFLAWTHADMQTDPADVLLGWERMLAQPDPAQVFVKGCRRGRNPWDVLFTLGMSLISSACLGVWLQDINAQPKIFSRRFFERMKSPPDDFSLDLYAYYLARTAGFQLLLQPVNFPKRRHGEAKGGATFAGKVRLLKRTWAYIFKLRREIARGQR